VRDELERAALPFDTAWSPSFRPQGPTLDDVRPDDYSHLVFICGPLHGSPIADLHTRFARCRRIAVGVTVLDPADPAVTGFDLVVARDGPGREPQVDLSAAAVADTAAVPVVGVALAHGQGEYGGARRHERVNDAVAAWLRTADCAAVPLDTRLDRADWTLARTPGQYISLLRRLDAVVTTRLHGLVLALANGVPALAVDPVDGGGKVSAQAAAWHWPVVLDADHCGGGDLDAALRSCLSLASRDQAAATAAAQALIGHDSATLVALRKELGM
jgi:hypothetical protein